MTSLKGRVLAGALIALASSGIGNFAVAQESTNRVATKTDWSVFTEATPQECWGVSGPKETVNTRDGAPVSVQRRHLAVCHVPARQWREWRGVFYRWLPLRPRIDSQHHHRHRQL